MSEDKKIKDGKKPFSSKPRERIITADEVFGGSTLNIPHDLKEEFESKGYTAKWLFADTVYKNGGYHPKGWKVYRRSSNDTMSVSEFSLGKDPEGVVRRGDLILGYKTKEEASLHREYLKQRSRSVQAVNADKASELRAQAKSAGMNAKIHEGYEDNE